MADIVVNLNKMRDTVQAYEDYKSKLERIQNNLNSAVNNLELNWGGAAQKSFKLNAYAELQKSIKAHINMIDDAKRTLDSMANGFSNLDNELK